MENNPSNANGQNEIYPMLDTKVQQKSHLDKLAEIFLPEDLDSIGNRVINAVILPAILKTAGDILHKTIDVIFNTNYTEINNPKPQSSPVTSWTSYNKVASQQPVGTMQVLPVRTGVYDYAQVHYRTLTDAQNVLNNMRAIISRERQVSVGKYLELSNAKTIPNDYNFGWTNLGNDIYAQETGDPGYPYKLVLPSPQPISHTVDRYYL